MSLAWSIERCAREYTRLTGRDAAEDGRLPYLEGVFAWRLERFRYDATSVLRTTLKTTRPLRGRNDDDDADWYARFKRAEPAFAAHAELHDGYEQGLSIIARSERTTLQRRTQELCAWLDAFERALADARNATNRPVLAFVLGAKARWAWKGWEAPTPMQLALLAGATGFEEFSKRETTRERWKSRLAKCRNVSVPDDFSSRAAADAEFDGKECFVLAAAPKGSAIPKLRVALPLDETG